MHGLLLEFGVSLPTGRAVVARLPAAPAATAPHCDLRATPCPFQVSMSGMRLHSDAFARSAEKGRQAPDVPPIPRTDVFATQHAWQWLPLNLATPLIPPVEPLRSREQLVRASVQVVR
ncbi:hypothetical protein Bxe_C1297 [Paraburkholderia xenovorans LB400]|uniref:Uncharacterized protein n=1 Tax=Paraburkholderia xenovorans (strain LB400) TaxID=266265 RepID=Q13FI3_PARXL|nr:hypothetical protein Bxe_C1297 [Paraburkholderia xenovorans LB400]